MLVAADPGSEAGLFENEQARQMVICLHATDATNQAAVGHD
jgi:hypothetical protein